MRGTGRLVNSKCCGERGGHVVEQPLGRVVGAGLVRRRAASLAVNGDLKILRK
jgi:hypothetical protein